MECWEYWSHATYSIKITVFNGPYFPVIFSTAELYIGKFFVKQVKSPQLYVITFVFPSLSYSSLMIQFVTGVIFVSLK